MIPESSGDTNAYTAYLGELGVLQRQPSFFSALWKGDTTRGPAAAAAASSGMTAAEVLSLSAELTSFQGGPRRRRLTYLYPAQTNDQPSAYHIPLPPSLPDLPLLRCPSVYWPIATRTKERGGVVVWLAERPSPEEEGGTTVVRSIRTYSAYTRTPQDGWTRPTAPSLTDAPPAHRRPLHDAHTDRPTYNVGGLTRAARPQCLCRTIRPRCFIDVLHP
jgi:hypothetical protein